MLQFDYVLETLAPLCFAEQSGDNVLYATKQYIPGASLRGALAAAYIRKYSLVEAHKDPLFRKLFLTGEVRYLPAYPQSEVGVTAMPVPLSVMISKDGNTIVDFSNGIDAKVGFKKLSGFVAIDETKKLLITVSPNVQIEFHMSRAGEKERISGSSIDGKVFNYEYLEPYQKFAGRVLVNDGCDDAIAELKQLLQGKLGLGRSRSSQYGTCSCKLQGEHNVELNDKIPQELYLLAYSAYIPGEGWQRTDDLAKELVEELNTALEAGGSNVRLSTEHTQIFAGCCFCAALILIFVLRQIAVKNKLTLRQMETLEKVRKKQESGEGSQLGHSSSNSEDHDGEIKGAKEQEAVEENWELLNRRRERYEMLLGGGPTKYFMRMFYPIKV